MKMITIIQKPRAAGKTTAALIALHKAGGGLYICRDIGEQRQALMLANRLDLKNIQFLCIDVENVVIDDDSVGVIITRNDKQEIAYNG